MAIWLLSELHETDCYVSTKNLTKATDKMKVDLLPITEGLRLLLYHIKTVFKPEGHSPADV